MVELGSLARMSRNDRRCAIGEGYYVPPSAYDCMRARVDVRAGRTPCRQLRTALTAESGSHGCAALEMSNSTHVLHLGCKVGAHEHLNEPSPADSSGSYSALRSTVVREQVDPEDTQWELRLP